jgi:hypothetical protein
MSKTFRSSLRVALIAIMVLAMVLVMAANMIAGVVFSLESHWSRATFNVLVGWMVLWVLSTWASR